MTVLTLTVLAMLASAGVVARGCVVSVPARFSRVVLQARELSGAISSAGRVLARRR